MSDGPQRLKQLTPEEVLAVLPRDAPAELRAAIQSGCCIQYTVSEGHCGSGGCGAGRCCYHVYGPACQLDYYTCLDYPCSHGNFSTGC